MAGMLDLSFDFDFDFGCDLECGFEVDFASGSSCGPCYSLNHVCYYADQNHF